MEKNDSNKSHGKKNTGKIRIAFSAMIAFVLFLAEIYMMINSYEYFEGLVAVTVLLIAVIYILVVSVIQVNYEKEQNLLDEFDNIFNSEKATYILLKKNFEEFNERLAFLEDNTKTPTEEIIAAQKAIAKVNISRNKENTDALMNSNSKMINKISDFEEMIISNNDKLLQQQRLIIDQANKEILMKQQEAMARMRELELSVKNQILQSVGMAAQSKKDFESTSSLVKDEPSFGGFDDADNLNMSLDFNDEIMINDVDVSENIGESEPEIGVFEDEEPVIDLEDELVLDSEDDLMAGLEDDPSAILFSDADIDNENVSTEAQETGALKEAEKAEKAEEIKEAEVVQETEEVKEAEAIQEAEEIEKTEEPAQQVKAPELDLSDPNKVMSPDDIAALLASM